MTTKKLFLKLEYLDFGSLDMECDYCNSNSYKKNFHISIGGLNIVVCEDCLAKAKSSSNLPCANNGGKDE